MFKDELGGKIMKESAHLELKQRHILWMMIAEIKKLKE